MYSLEQFQEKQPHLLRNNVRVRDAKHKKINIYICACRGEESKFLVEFIQHIRNVKQSFWKYEMDSRSLSNEPLIFFICSLSFGI